MTLEPLNTLLRRLLTRLGVRPQTCLHLLLSEGVSRIVEIGLKLISRLDDEHLGLILRLKLRSGRNHLLDLILRKTTLIIRNGDLIRLTRRLLRGVNIQNTVCVQIIRDLNLRHTTRHRRNSFQAELSEKIVVLREVPLTLKDQNINSGLIILIRREGLRLLCRDCRIPLDQRRHHTARRLNT